MKKIFLAVLLLPALHAISTENIHALASERGVGIVPAPGNAEVVSLKATAARASRWGLAPSQLWGEIFVPHRNPLSAEDFRSFSYSATVSVYLKTADGERLVHTGSMEPLQFAVPLWIPPTNLKPEGRSHAFMTEIGNPKNSKSLKLTPGNYRAEAVFYHQDLSAAARAIGWVPPRVEVGGAAADFTVADYHLADLVDARGEIRVQSSLTPRKGATATQVAQLKASARAEYERVTSASRGFLKKEAAIAVGAPSRAPWIFTETPSSDGNFSETFFHLQSGESYAANANSIRGALTQIVRSGNVTRRLPGGIFKITTTSNITLHPR